MRKMAVVATLLVVSVALASCAPNYADIVKQQLETDNVTPITLVEANEVEEKSDGDMTVITFVLTDGGVSVDKIVNFYNFYSGAEGDVLYLVRNEGSRAIKPTIKFVRHTRVEDYSEVEGQGYFDAPAFVEDWITITPEPYLMPPNTAQGYIVNFAMPKDVRGFPDKFAFQVAVEHGFSIHMRASTWWLIHMR